MNVGLIHYAAPPVVGGVERILARHAQLLARAGHRVRVIAGRGEPDAVPASFHRVPRVDSRHPEVLSVKAELDQGQVTPQFEHLRAAIGRDLGDALAGLDVLIAHNVCSLHKNLALTAALHALSQPPGGPRLVLWHHDLAWTAAHYQAELHPGYPWDLLRTAWPGARQVAISAQRRDELAHLMGLDPKAIVVVPNGIDLAAFFRLEADTQALVAALRLEAACPRLLLPVRITPRKNIELALRMLSELRRAEPAAALVVTGPPGPHNPANAAYLERLVRLRHALGLEGSAHFLAEHTPAPLPDAVVADFYRLADALFLPSREEGFGLPVLEAALSRLPVFCADVPSLRALGGAEAAYFAPDAQPAAVAALVAQRLRADPAFQLAVRTRQQYAWPAIYANLIEPVLQP